MLGLRTSMAILALASASFVAGIDAAAARDHERFHDDCQAHADDPAASTEDITCPGIRPGTHLLTPTGATCTFAFFVTHEVRTFVTTAGHCIREGLRARLYSTGEEIGTAVLSPYFAHSRDFALIEIDSDALSLVNPEMCTWGGPTGMFQGDTIARRVVQSTGHGAGYALGDAPPRPGAGLGDTTTDRKFTYYGNLRDGDSGSPVRLETGEALGIANSINPPQFGTSVTGTRLDASLAYAAENGFPDLRLVTA